MQNNNSADRSLTAGEAYARMTEDLPSEYPAATKSRIDPAAPDLDSNWMHTHTVLRRGANLIEAEKVGIEPWKVVVQVDTESREAGVTHLEIVNAIAQASQYIMTRDLEEQPVPADSNEPSGGDRQAILSKVIAAAPAWALPPTVEDLFGPVNGMIEVQYDGQNLAVDDLGGWTARAHLSQTIVFDSDGEIVKTLPIEPVVFIENPGPHAVNAGREAAGDLETMEALMKSGTALIQLANALAEAHFSELRVETTEGS